jgi:RimJ/RimL family protein N-acetyltransferase
MTGWCARHSFRRFTDEQQARDFVGRVEQQFAEAQPTRLAFAMVDRASGEFVGLCGLVFKPELQDAEVWYLLRPDRWGSGIASEAVHALVEHALGAYRLHRIWASCLPENGASVRVLEKVGFRREGLLRQNLPIQGAWRDTYLYALLAGEWVGRAAPRPAA